MTQHSTRRTVLATGAAALAVGCAGCGGDKSGSPPSVGGQELARTSDIPEGGGRIFKEQKVVVTQPEKGDFKAFSAICTHMGCTVNQVADGTIDCPCHGSKYRIADGSVAHGPAPKPLPPETIRVEGNSIRLA
ncbi:iron-sulfur protein [Streptomyces cellostaticus]|uniref:Cytochrome bc1 complex Rieske iron-sulfur subunit n=1 Tax=Streptomyces cellostaticus TaxID=67285 RepID=A0A101NEV2_9ACTN|nr:Rieske (2Fe-2S) protein [Streptomyces cellostaticus]KUM91830.1 iron-sulfur protein [Streptomyces cellostaticus]GHI08798.1 iron-sulfur protein [Streptomyces cellostaticus]